MVRFMQAGKPRRLVLYCLDEFVDDSLLGTQVGGLIGHSVCADDTLSTCRSQLCLISRILLLCIE